MSNPYIGEIRMAGFNFAPNGWAFCDGSSQLIADNQALFALIGTTYGGDGQTTFNLPDLRGRVPVHQGSGLVLGQNGGEENHTLTLNELPAHTHAQLAVGGEADSVDASVGFVARAPLYAATGQAAMNAAAIPAAGGTQPHNNMPPVQCVNFIISLFGIFPSQ